ncbi:MAG: hypothetical protein EAZ30_08010 [Betaproteobacteria bacterium]|nr:MAG: hypothetical protein EAZ30_08010 [Betaproteobacteria bacterium]
MNRTLKWLAVAIASSASVLLVGCGNKPPKCGDEEVTNLVLQVFREAVEKEAASMSEERLARFRYTQRDAKPMLETITAQSIDEKVAKATCQATLRVSVPAEAIAALSPETLQLVNAKFETVGSRIERASIVSNIQYSAQRTENAKELEVFVQGHKFTVDLLHEVALLRFFDKPFPPEPAATAPSGASATTLSDASTAPKASADTQANVASGAGATSPNMTPAAAEQTKPVQAATSLPKSPLCTANEEAVFSCSTGKKQIAVCATSGAANAAMQLTYRIAPTGQAAEMTYPSSPAPAKSAFKLGSATYTGDKSMSFLSFDKGDIRYVAYIANGKAFDKAGVAVEQGGKRIANLVCASELTDRLGELDSAGIPTDSRSFALP